MTHPLTWIFDLIGVIGFFVAFIIAFLKSKRSRQGFLDYWGSYTIAAFILFAWAFLVLLEWVNFYPVLFDEVQQRIIAAAITAFVIAVGVTKD